MRYLGATTKDGLDRNVLVLEDLKGQVKYCVYTVSPFVYINMWSLCQKKVLSKRIHEKELKQPLERRSRGGVEYGRVLLLVLNVYTTLNHLYILFFL